ncbi:MAG: hypothetical protein QXU87_03980 [Candidatus Caldarchaeum sp.]
MVSDVPPPEEAKKIAENLFKREAELDVLGVKFRVRRMTLKEELDWYEFRDKIFKNDAETSEKLVKIWEELLQRCVVEPRCARYTEELPGPVIMRLIDAISELHLWNVDFRLLRRASS